MRATPDPSQTAPDPVQTVRRGRLPQPDRARLAALTVGGQRAEPQPSIPEVSAAPRQED